MLIKAYRTKGTAAVPGASEAHGEAGAVPGAASAATDGA
jgi:hypothetical protein